MCEEYEFNHGGVASTVAVDASLLGCVLQGGLGSYVLYVR